MTRDLEKLEAVYYPAPSPTSLASLTVLACVFDRIHFPGVHLPEEFDEIAEREDLKRRQPPKDQNDVQQENLRRFALIRHHVRDLCLFTGMDKDTFGYLEPGTREVATALEEAIWGPPPPNFHPHWPDGFANGMLGSEEAIRSPGSITYPASALLYSARLQLPLITDDPSLPMPALPDGVAKNNTKLLATITALECVRLVLPKLPVLSPRDIGEVRAETRDVVRPFRLAVLRLAGDLNALIQSDTPMREVQQTAKALAETRVYPELMELRGSLENPSRPWHKRAVAVFKEAPDLAQAFMTLPTSIAVAKVLGKLTTLLSDLRDEELERDGARRRSKFHYLLRLPELMSTK